MDYRIQIALPCLLNLSVTKCAKLMRFNKITVLKATLLVILVHFLALYFHNLQFCPELIPIIIIFSFPFEFGQKGLGVLRITGAAVKIISKVNKEMGSPIRLAALQ